MSKEISDVVRRSVVLFCSFVIAQGLFFASPSFKISKIEVKGNNFVDTATLIKNSPFQVGDWFWIDWVCNGNLVADDPVIESSTIRLKPSGVLVISVKEREPVALVWTDKLKSCWAYVDKTGHILGEETVENQSAKYPRLKLNFPLAINGGMVRTDLIKILLQIDPEISKFKELTVNYYLIDDMQNISVFAQFLGEETEIRLGSLENISSKLERLKAILSLEKRKLSWIDVRFQIPAVLPLDKDKVKLKKIAEDKRKKDEATAKDAEKVKVVKVEQIKQNDQVKQTEKVKQVEKVKPVEIKADSKVESDEEPVKRTDNSKVIEYLQDW
ncbi:hypothetical protein IJT10_02265 [bacterium]|nr:hypothetical protein [bacterium]